MLFGLLTKGTMKDDERAIAKATFELDLRSSKRQFFDYLEKVLALYNTAQVENQWDLPPHVCENPHNYSWCFFVAVRIKMAAFFFERLQSFMYRKNKIMRRKILWFQTKHVPMAKFLQLHGCPADTNINEEALLSLYEPFTQDEALHFDDSRDFIVVHQTKHQLRETPLEILERRFPQHGWRIENVKIDIEFARAHYDPLKLGEDKEQTSRHLIYYACLTILAQCAKYGDLEDAAYFYYMSFLDLFYFCLSQECMSDKFLHSRYKKGQLSVLDVFYPHDNRAFTCWDLPDMYNVLFFIPLSGEPMKPRTTIERYLQKCLPFCGQRRTFVEIFVKTLKNNQSAESEIIRHVIWCFLANAYPKTKKVFDMLRLMRVRQLCSDGRLLAEALSREKFPPDKKETYKGCEIIINAFRLWIYAMAFRNKLYQDHASKYLDWNAVVANSQHAAFLAQKCNIYGDDAFAEIRAQLSDSKMPKTRVERYKKEDRLSFVLAFFKEALEKHVFKLGNSPTMSKKIKENILHLLLRVHTSLYLDPHVLGMLQSPEYGGLSRGAIGNVMGLFHAYDSNYSTPRKMRDYMAYYDSVLEIEVLTWYLTIVARLSKIQLVPLDQATVEKIDNALEHKKYAGVPEMADSVYNVLITICCKRIVTNMGTFAFGTSEVYYDAIQRRHLCNKTYKVDEDNIAAEVDIQQLRKNFSTIPCNGNPILRVNLRGYMLVYGISRNKTLRFMHCPQCGSFHQYDWANWAGGATYRCGECRSQQQSTYQYFSCFHCETMLSSTVAGRCSLEILSDPFRRVYFCEKHFKHAKRYGTVVMEDQLRAKIAAAEGRSLLRAAKRYI